MADESTPLKPKSTHETIIHILSHQHPLSTKQLHHVIQKEEGMSITYQAIHKALHEMEEETIIEKNNQKEWKLNPNWLEKQKKFYEKTIETYEQKKNKYYIDPNKNETQTFEFDNFTELCVETAKLVADSILCKNKESSYFVMKYGLWTLKFKFEHLSLLRRLVLSRSSIAYNLYI